MGTCLQDFRRLLDDCELFIFEILQDENLSESAEKTRQVLLNNFRVVHARNPQEFPLEEDVSDDNRSSSLGRSAPSDDASVASDYQDDVPDYLEDNIPVAAQDLTNILKQGYLEKNGRRDVKRVYKQQKGSFYIGNYSAQLVPNLRKDSKKKCCFELTAPGRRAFQFAANSPQEAKEWVDQINFVLKDLSSTTIPVDDDEDEEDYDDIVPGSPPQQLHTRASQNNKQSGEEDWEAEDESEKIYEVLPGTRDSSSDFANYYQGLWDCQADEPDELDFQRGDLIYIISKEYNIHGWWVGELNGTVGIVPKDFLQPAYIL
uniref:Src kinase-associated phosphoprotein 1 n=1 Tax=Oryzias sinensis TaxID=183150 RepID=A0A8C7XP33_9TELE